MREVTVSKSDLIQRVETNQADHVAVFDRAIVGYRHAAMAFFNEQIDKASRGEQFETYFKEPIPEDHSEDYEAALDMLAMSQDESITLTAQEFRQYVRDDWGWKRAWTETTSNYIGPAGA